MGCSDRAWFGTRRLRASGSPEEDVASGAEDVAHVGADGVAFVGLQVAPLGGQHLVDIGGEIGVGGQDEAWAVTVALRQESAG